MRIQSVSNANMKFGVKVCPRLRGEAERAADTPLKREFLEKRLAEIETYGDKNTKISMDYYPNVINKLVICYCITNPVLPRTYMKKYTPLLFSTDPEVKKFPDEVATGYDAIKMLSPDLVEKWEREFFADPEKYRVTNPNFKFDP